MRALLLLAVLVGSSAGATWRSGTVGGTPRDVVIPDAGRLLVATTLGPGAVVYTATAAGGVTATTQVLTGNFASAVERGSCLMGITQGGAPSVVFCSGDNYGFYRGGTLRTSWTGGVYRYDYNNAGSQARIGRLDPAAGTFTDNFTTFTTGGALWSPFLPLSVVALSDAGEWVGTATVGPGLLVTRDPLPLVSIPVGNVRDVSLFELAGKPGAVVVTDAGLLLFSEDVSVPDGGFFTVPVQAPFSSVTFSAADGGPYGRGFGMATAGSQIYSPVPNPNALGRQWVLRTGGGTPSGLVRATCLDPGYCVGMAGATPPNLWAYFNESAPTAAFTGVTVPAGMTTTYVLDAGDADGDPIWVTWIDGGFFWPGGDPLTVTVIGPPGGGSCVAPPTAPPLQAVLSDGLRTTTILIPVTVTGGLAGPALQAFPLSVPLATGGAGVSVSVTNGDAGCAVPPLSWSVTGGGNLTLSSDGGATVVVSPPFTYCSPDAGKQTFTLTADSADASVSIPVILSPWGPPNAPSFASPVQQLSGTDASYPALSMPADHVCAGPNFPGTFLMGWDIDAGVPGVTAVGTNTALNVFSTNACVGGTVTARAARQVIGPFGDVSAISNTLVVQLLPAATTLLPTPAAVSLKAGGAAASVSVANGDAGCAVPPLSWSLSGGGAVSLSSDGGATALLTPPSTYCSPDGGVFTLTATAPDASVGIPVTLNPWGAPNVPTFPAQVQLQPAGTDASYPALNQATDHTCAGPGFPGTSLVGLTIDAGVPGVTARWTTTSLEVYSTERCAAGLVTATAAREVLGPSAERSGPSGLLAVQLVANPTPIDATTPFDAGFAWSPAQSRLSGAFSSGADCPTARDLRAGVTVTLADGGPVASATALAVPGPWGLVVPGGCNGGVFLASASLVDDAGTAYGQTVSFAFDAGRIPARVPQLKVDEFSVTCAEGARGELELEFSAADCATQQYRWIKDQGPALVVAPSTGAKVAFATAPDDLEAQAGRVLSFAVTATVGPGNEATAVRSVRLRPTPFITITHRASTPAPLEEEALGVEVTLKNNTGCTVGGLLLQEQLDGLEPNLASVRLDGVKREATRVGDVLEVADLTLPGGRSIRLSFLARTRLLSRSHPQGVVLLNGINVTDPTLAPVPGCGCDSAGGGLLALLVLVGGLVRSRRRSG